LSGTNNGAHAFGSGRPPNARDVHHRAGVENNKKQWRTTKNSTRRGEQQQNSTARATGRASIHGAAR
jgi:hypothetical protein